ncbi:hypothetical protein ACFX13_025070 [Malus domestica]
MGSEKKNGVGVAAAQFPPTTRKIIQSLKEIVNCPEPEIYSVLKECSMDPSDAVQRLLSLDTFHEVKSKRERRKEIKETQDTKSRVHNAGSNRGARGINERTGGWCGSTQTSSNELGKAAYKGQNGFVAPSPHTSASHFTGGTTSQQPSSQRESFSTSIRPGDAISASLQPSTGNQSTYGTGLGNLSMADIVKMGRQPSMGSHISSDTSLHQDAFSTNSCNSHVESSQTEMHSHNPHVSEMLHKTGDSAGQNYFHDEWRVIEQPTAANRSSALNANQSKFYINESNVPRDYQSHKVQESEGNISSESVSSDCNAYAFASSRQKMADASSGKSYCVDDLSSNSSSYESHRFAYENGEGTDIGSNASYPNHSVSNDVAVASATVRMQQLNLRKDEHQDNCAVVLPNNLQELAADCSHLSFGTFRPAQSSALSSKPSNSLKNDLGGSSAGIDVILASRLDTRHENSGYNHDELLGSLYDTRRAAIGYDLPVPSQREPIKQDILEAARGYRDITTSSLHNFNSEKIEKATSGLPFAKADPEFRNVPKNDMAYSDSARSDLLESFQQFLVKPPVPSRYSSAVSSVNNPTISMSEALRPGTVPLSEACSVLPQCPTARSYAQPTLSYEQLANGMVYKPSIPQAQNYSPVPPNLQQEYVGGSAFHMSGASMEYNFPQYSGAPVSRLPTSAAAAVTGHGRFGASNNTHGSLLHNASATPGSIPDYDDVFRPQYKDGNHLAALYQSSRTLPSVPDRAFNNLHGHNQQQAGYRQGPAGQLPTQLQNYLGHSDFYFSQKDVTQEHQRQRLNDLGLGGFQDLSPQQLHQIWQRTY